MKLEPELIKAILIWCEKQLPDENKSWEASNLEINGYNQNQIIFHTKLLLDNGYIEGEKDFTLSSRDYSIENLTMNGYQYLNLLRSKTWNTAKKTMKEVGIIFVESAIKAVIDRYLAGI